MLQFLAGNGLARPFQEGQEHLQRPVAEAEPNPALQELARGRVQLERPEANGAARGAVGHGLLSRGVRSCVGSLPAMHEVVKARAQLPCIQ